MTEEHAQLARFEALFQRGTELLLDGNPRKALPLLEAAVEILPDHFEALLNLSSVYILSSKFKKATPILEGLIKIEPENAILYQNLGAAILGNPALATNEQQLQAIESFKNALKINPIAPNVAYNIGLIYRDRGEALEAIYWFKMAVQADPTDDDARRQITRVESMGDDDGNG